ncbi:MAG: sulfonate ABC transporter substrate-binding protein [Thiotrichaceae bacterium]|nr:sulfonate ABC transporter substrate-binding protein [Thiotrichaceae bacterium]
MNEINPPLSRQYPVLEGITLVIKFISILTFISLILVLSSRVMAGEHLRIGYQKYGSLPLLKARGDLDKHLSYSGIEVLWIPFSSSSKLLEGIALGSIDFGATGETSPIFAQAAGAALFYVGYEPPAPRGEAILLPKNSPIRTLAGLRGKKIGFDPASDVHYLLLQALENAGISYEEIQVIYLPTHEARAAFENGSVDAWVVCDPYLAAVQRDLDAKVLTDGTGLVNNHQFYLTSQTFAAQHPKVVQILLEEIKELDEWSKRHLGEVVEIFSPELGLETKVVQVAASRTSYGVQAMNEAVVKEQQQIANSFRKAGLLQQNIQVASSIWLPRQTLVLRED